MGCCRRLAADGGSLLQPVSDDSRKGYVDFVIKAGIGSRSWLLGVWSHTLLLQIYPDGKLTQYLDTLKEGDQVPNALRTHVLVSAAVLRQVPAGQVLVKGPKGRFAYKRNMKRHIGELAQPGACSSTGAHTASDNSTIAGMVAGGTGITPMFQTANQILQDKADTTSLSLIYANLSQDDILIKDLLDHLAATHPDRCHAWASAPRLQLYTLAMVQSHLTAAPRCKTDAPPDAYDRRQGSQTVALQIQGVLRAGPGAARLAGRDRLRDSGHDQSPHRAAS